jgi:hypothetical protein
MRDLRGLPAAHPQRRAAAECRREFLRAGKLRASAHNASAGQPAHRRPRRATGRRTNRTGGAGSTGWSVATPPAGSPARELAGASRQWPGEAAPGAHRRACPCDRRGTPCRPARRGHRASAGEATSPHRRGTAPRGAPVCGRCPSAPASAPGPDPERPLSLHARMHAVTPLQDGRSSDWAAVMLAGRGAASADQPPVPAQDAWAALPVPPATPVPRTAPQEEPRSRCAQQPPAVYGIGHRRITCAGSVASFR